MSLVLTKSEDRDSGCTGACPSPPQRALLPLAHSLQGTDCRRNGNRDILQVYPAGGVADHGLLGTMCIPAQALRPLLAGSGLRPAPTHFLNVGYVT